MLVGIGSLHLMNWLFLPGWLGCSSPWLFHLLRPPALLERGDSLIILLPRRLWRHISRFLLILGPLLGHTQGFECPFLRVCVPWLHQLRGFPAPCLSCLWLMVNTSYRRMFGAELLSLLIVMCGGALLLLRSWAAQKRLLMGSVRTG